MPWQQKISYLIGQPVGISLTNGQGATGVLCGLSGKKILVIEYLYQAQFALKQYDAFMIQDINGFPSCHNQQPLY
ncbi:hypothetical protein [Cytobacillus horneckiae]|uniref:DUF2642 domain-containing protein n=1 Tax=Cytobacillus horneckiae TaxID=549687 RepID=A0A2N0ZJD2_9BACI|nr:hypothetical protein [Cytobacillus horneckiae]MEC1153997.1 hypothetical protein [Cytobacillus horneckiae]MED2938572.1 hypothetical protein [Cytobacillus horneckiae]NRG48137.1 hypothetical protein [Bacillus sp. CRN 9]PKG29622.1 hypothetical protein CWS20_07075 [Cytobacillus horneckiae]